MKLNHKRILEDAMEPILKQLQKLEDADKLTIRDLNAIKEAVQDVRWEGELMVHTLTQMDKYFGGQDDDN